MSDDDAPAITFVERHDPALRDGTYSVVVTHAVTSTVTPAADTDPIAESLTHERRFAVSGPRFSLAPDAIVGMFPPPNGQGEYATALPHVAFSRLTLPWARAADAAGTLPWLALVVIDDAEGVTPAAAHVSDLQRSALGPTTASYADAAGDLVLEYGQDWSDPCRVIDVPVDLWAAIAPSTDDLAWLAHTRVSTAGDQAAISVVVANRTPPTTGSATAHLVSLEGLAEWLPDRAGKAAAIAVGGVAATAVRLVSLASWTFSALTMEETFAGRLHGVSSGAFALPPVGDGSGAAGTAHRAIAAGYCALRHRTRSGEETVSWYRGPLAPCPVAPGRTPLPDPSTGAEPVGAADQLLRYDAATGMLDVSYAAAWQLGRLLAVQEDRFAAGLRAWKATLSQRTAVAAEAELISARVGEAVDPANPAALLRGRLVGALQADAATTEPDPAAPATGALFDLLNAAVGDLEALAEQHADAELPPELADWLGGLARLQGVPIGYLVPDERLLPAASDNGASSGSIRFFQVDGNWIAALLEGAFSIARASRAAAAHDTALAPVVAAAAPTPAASGFLLRSTVVDAWGDLQVTARDKAGKPLGVVRLDRLEPGCCCACSTASSPASISTSRRPRCTWTSATRSRAT